MNKKKMLITGTTKGIGKKIVQTFEEKYEIIGINRRDDPNLSNNIICDLYDVGQIIQVSKAIYEYNIDILINNAGGAIPRKFIEITERSIYDDMNLNFVAPTLLMKSVMDGMKLRGYGRIINISSISAKIPTPYLDIYSASKCALDSVTVSVAKLYTKYGITINSICPASIETITSIEGRRKLSELNDMEGQAYQELMIKNTGLNRLIKTDEVVSLISYLLSDEAAAISGQKINVSGVL